MRVGIQRDLDAGMAAEDGPASKVRVGIRSGTGVPYLSHVIMGGLP
jgi:hypothetical protein